MADETTTEQTDKTTAVMDAKSSEFGTLYDQLKNAKPTEPKTEVAETKADVKVEKKAETKAEVKDDKQAEIDGLKKELTRLRADRRDDRTKDERIAKLEGHLEAIQAAQKANGQKSVKDFSVEELDTLEVDWMAYLAKAQQEESADAVAKAKANLSAIRKEQRVRVQEQRDKKLEEDKEQDTLKTEMLAMYEDLYMLFPEMKDKDSALFAAAEKEYQKLPKKLQESGPVGDMRAILKAISKQPDLVKRGDKSTEVRKDMLKNLEKAADKALQTGGGNAAVSTTPNIDALPQTDFEAIVKRMKLGQGLTT